MKFIFLLILLGSAYNHTAIYQFLNEIHVTRVSNGVLITLDKLGEYRAGNVTIITGPSKRSCADY